MTIQYSAMCDEEELLPFVDVENFVHNSTTTMFSDIFSPLTGGWMLSRSRCVQLFLKT